MTKKQLASFRHRLKEWYSGDEEPNAIINDYAAAAGVPSEERDLMFALPVRMHLLAQREHGQCDAEEALRFMAHVAGA